MEEQEKKTITLPSIQWRETQRRNLFAVEHFRPNGEIYRSGNIFRIGCTFPDTEGKIFYKVRITGIESCFNLKYYPDTLEEAKQICEDYRKKYWEEKLNCNIAIDEKLTCGFCYMIDEGTFQFR
jgi:hypothetical protein